MGVEEVGDLSGSQRWGVEEVGDLPGRQRWGFEEVGDLFFRQRWGLEEVVDLFFRQRWGLEEVGDPVFRQRWGLEEVVDLFFRQRWGLEEVGGVISRRRCWLGEMGVPFRRRRYALVAIALRCPRYTMLQALLRGKLDRWLSKDAYTIEDLLTSVVLGSACYAPHEEALLPFLREAVDEHGKTLAAHLTDVASVTAEFWPNWGASEAGPDEDDDTEARAEHDEDDPQPADGPRPARVVVPRSQPEVVLDVERTDGKRQLILLEVKLHSGKSSHASGNGVVTDQLAKYWCQLKREAEQRSAEALAVVYLTKGIGPLGEVRRIRREDLIPKPNRLGRFDETVEGGELLSIAVPLVSLVDEQAVMAKVIEPLLAVEYSTV